MKKHPQILISWLVIIFPALFIAGLSVPDAGLSTIAALFLAHSYLNNDWSWCKENWVRCLALLCGYMVVRGLFTDTPKETALHALVFSRYFIGALGVALALQDLKTRNLFLKVLFLVIVFVLIDSLFQLFNKRDVIGEIITILHINIPMQNFDVYVQPNGNIRLTAAFRKPIVGWMLAWFAFPVFMQLFLEKNNYLIALMRRAGCATTWSLVATLQTILIILFIVATVAIIALSGDRTGFLLTLFGFAIAIILLKQYRLHFILTLVAFFAVFLLVSHLRPMTAERQAHSTVDTIHHWSESPYGRLLATDLLIAKVNPIFGIGDKHFQATCPKFYPDLTKEQLAQVCYTHPHNIYLEWFIEEGAIGLSLFLLFIGLVIGKTYQAWKIHKQNLLFIGFLIAFALRLFPFIAEPSMFSRWGAPPFWLIFGGLLVWIAVNNKEKNKEKLYES